MKLTKEEQLIQNRLIDLANLTFNKDLPTFSDFLTLNDINCFLAILNDLPNIKYELYGGYLYAERKILGFYPVYYEDDKLDFPICCLEIKPLHSKYSQELNHRDCLGTILNLGLDRSKIGDIVVKDKIAFVFCYKDIAEFIEQNLYRIKRTDIQVNKLYKWEDKNLNPNFKTIQGTVSSIRLDTVVALGFQKSRSKITSLIQGGKVFVNSKLIQSNSYTLREGDIISVRGLGKIIYKSIQQQTRKGRYFIKVDRFI